MEYDPVAPPMMRSIGRVLTPPVVIDNLDAASSTPIYDIDLPLQPQPMVSEHAGTNYELTQSKDGCVYAISAVHSDGSITHEILDLSDVILDWITQITHQVPPGVSTLEAKPHG